MVVGIQFRRTGAAGVARSWLSYWTFFWFGTKFTSVNLKSKCTLQVFFAKRIFSLN